MIPVFSSTYSIGKSILSLDDPTEKDDGGSTSILSLLKEGDDLFLADTTMIGFPIALEKCKKYNINLRLGIILDVNIGSSVEEDYKNDSKIIVWAKNDKGYNDLKEIYFRSMPSPKDFNLIKEAFTEDVFVAIPFYDSFLAVNALTFSSQIPDLKGVEHVFFREDHGLPFDHILKKNLESYCKRNNSEIIDTHSIFYETDNDVTAYQVYRCICGRKGHGKGRKLTLSAPNLNHFGVDNFSWESYCAKVR